MMLTRTLLISLIFCLIASISFAAIQTVDFVSFSWAAGGSSAVTNGGAATKSAWDAGSPSDFFNTSTGAAIVSVNAVNVTTANAGSKLNINHAATTAVTTGTIALFDFAATYTDDYYVVTFVDNENVTIDVAYSGDTTCNIDIGGTIDGLASMIASATDLADATSVNCDVLIKGNEILGATVAISLSGGSATTILGFTGVNSSWVDDGTRVIITTASSLVNGLVSLSGGVSSIDFSNIDFDAGGVGMADYCIYNVTDIEESITFKNCLMHDADINGVHHGGSTPQDEWAIIGCEIYDNRGSGVRARSAQRGVIYLIGSSIHDNTVYGIYCGDYLRVYNNRIYDNGDSGLFISNSAAFERMIINNTFYGNGGDGFESVASSGFITIANNTSVANNGFGYNLAGMSMGEVFVFSNNHSKDNDADGSPDSATSHCSETSTLALFQVFGQGDNISGDPLFTNVTDGSEDFTPQSSSPLINAGIGGTGDTIGALCATAGAGGTGSVVGVGWN